MLRKTFSAVALLALSAGVHAEWKPLADSMFGAMTYDPASVKTEQGRTHMRYRIEFPAARKNAQGKEYRSATVNVDVDCKAAMVHVREVQTNAKPKGEGEVVDREVIAAAPGEKVAPSSSNEAIFKAACPGMPVPQKAADAAPPQPAPSAPASKSTPARK